MALQPRAARASATIPEAGSSSARLRVRVPHPLKLRIFVTHPVQYHVPLWRGLAAHPALDVKVFYFSDHSVRGGLDPGFGVPVSWDVDMLSGYAHEFLTRDADLQQPGSVRIPDARALLARERPDWVLFGGYMFGFERQLAAWSRRSGARVLLRAEFSDSSYGGRSAWKGIARDASLRAFYTRVDRFCYPGRSALTHLFRLGVPESRCFFSPYSVDDNLIARAKAQISRAAARAGLGLPADCHGLLFSGKLIARKAPLQLLDALERVPGRAKLALIVLGDGELRGELEPRARALLGERLIMPGFVNQSQLGAYFRAADALILPSVQETWGLVVNEAMHYGLPVLVSEGVGCHLDLVQEGVTGYVHRVADAAQMAEHIARLLLEPARAQRMGREAERLVARYGMARSLRGVLRALGLSEGTCSGVC
jgi:glycosyltransferase involved in cell wall biosynthesis